MAQWRVPDKYKPDFLAWNGDMYGPSTAARVTDGVIVVSMRDGAQFMYNNAADAKAALPKAPDVCLDETLAIQLGSPLVYGERCPLDYISWHALKTGIASPYATAHVLKLMITAKRCRVRLRRIPAGRIG